MDIHNYRVYAPLAFHTVQLNTGREIGTETCGVDDVFPPDDLWFGSDTNTTSAFRYD